MLIHLKGEQSRTVFHRLNCIRQEHSILVGLSAYAIHRRVLERQIVTSTVHYRGYEVELFSRDYRVQFHPQAEVIFLINSFCDLATFRLHLGKTVERIHHQRIAIDRDTLVSGFKRGVFRGIFRCNVHDSLRVGQLQLRGINIDADIFIACFHRIELSVGIRKEIERKYGFGCGCGQSQAFFSIFSFCHFAIAEINTQLIRDHLDRIAQRFCTGFYFRFLREEFEEL